MFDLPGHPSGPNDPGGTFIVKRSQDAAVGALVRMLKKAPPLHQGTSVSTQVLQGSNGIQDATEVSEEPGVQQPSASNLASSELMASKTTADALEELHGYRKMKDLLLKSK